MILARRRYATGGGYDLGWDDESLTLTKVWV